MFKQIYNREDGRPKLIESDYDGVFKFDEFLYTDIVPSSDLYEPYYFNGNEWIGATKEEHDSTLEPKPPRVPSNIEMQQARTQMQLTKTASQLQATQDQLAKAMLEIAKLKGGI